MAKVGIVAAEGNNGLCVVWDIIMRSARPQVNESLSRGSLH